MSNSAISGPIFTDVRRSPSGSAAAPSWSFADATGTGVYLASTDVLALSTAGVQRVVVDAAGNVGIGGAPNDWGSNYTALEVGNDSGNGWMTGASGYSQSFFTVNSYFNGTAWVLKHNGQAKRFVMDPANNAFIFSSAAGTAGQTITWNEHMRIDASGNLLVGTANATVSADNGFRFIPSPVSANMSITVNTSNGADSNYHLYNRNATNNGYRFYVGANGGIINYSANNVNLSDQRVKTDISLAGSYLEKICAIPVKTFRYKDQGDDADLTLGVIAQDVEAVAPELVNTTDGFGETPEDGVPLKTVYQTDLQYALMKCIQEQQEIIGKLEARLAALESK